MNLTPSALRHLTVVFVLLFIAVGIFPPTATAQVDNAKARGATFDEVWNHVNEQFYDPDFNGVDWDAQRAKYRPLAITAEDPDEFARIVNEMLDSLGASHTAYFPTSDPRRYQMLGIFRNLVEEEDSNEFFYDGIGIETKRREGKTFVSAVYDGLPAASSGLKCGDEIVSIEDKPFHPILSFAGQAGSMLKLQVRRRPKAERNTEEILEIPVRVERLDSREMFLTALNESARIIESNGKEVGYVHVWSYAGTQFHEALQSLLLWGKLKDCDALVLDLRDGWGGASVNYVNLFREPIVTTASKFRSGESFDYSGVWGKPVALLINGGSRSGKELFTFAFKKLELGPVVGSTTGGAVLAGRGFLLGNGAVLYVALGDIKVDGQRIEGRGVAPTIPIERPLSYAAGADPPLDRAIEVISQ